MTRSARILATAGLVGVASGPGAAQRRIPDSDRYIKSGTRLPPVAPGEGGHIRIVAPVELCRDSAYLLEVRLITDAGGIMPVVRLPAGPSPCDWTFEDLPASPDAAVIENIKDERVVASAKGLLSRGTAILLTLESVETEVDGLISAQGELPVHLRLSFNPSGPPSVYNTWKTPVGRQRRPVSHHDPRTRSG